MTKRKPAKAPATARPAQADLMAMIADAHPYSAEESELATMDPAWADFAAHVRIGANLKRTKRELHTTGLPAVHAMLDVDRKALESGDRAAIVRAMTTCCEENVPLPYWLADAFLAALRRVQTVGGSLHDALGLADTLPPKGKKARTKRQQRQDAVIIWHEVATLMHTKRMSKEAAIQRVLPSLRLGYSPRKARDMFDAQDKRQRAMLEALKSGNPQG